MSMQNELRERKTRFVALGNKGAAQLSGENTIDVLVREDNHLEPEAKAPEVKTVAEEKPVSVKKPAAAPKKKKSSGEAKAARISYIDEEDKMLMRFEAKAAGKTPVEILLELLNEDEAALEKGTADITDDLHNEIRQMKLFNNTSWYLTDEDKARIARAAAKNRMNNQQYEAYLFRKFALRTR